MYYFLECLIRNTKKSSNYNEQQDQYHHQIVFDIFYHLMHIENTQKTTLKTDFTIGNRQDDQLQ